MNKLKETDSLIDYITADLEKNPNPNTAKAANVILLADIAKSLAMIADKLYKAESEDET